MASKHGIAAELIREWLLPPEATLGSSVRAKGILQEIRARLAFQMRKALAIRGSMLTLRLPESASIEFTCVSALISTALDGIESLPVIPREIEDILAIKSSERHRWLKDGRLPSAGTRTVKLRGRARKITFHVLEPAVVLDILDRDLIDRWREEDAERAAENRRRAAWKRQLARSPAASATPNPESGPDDDTRHQLRGWAEFERDGLLR